jgi:chemotaxis protein CheD
MIKISVGISELKVVNTPATLDTQSLGSCLGIVIFDPLSKVAGLAHTMLPDSKQANVGNKPGKYVDTAIAEMLSQMTNMGAGKNVFVAKLVGGACMFSGSAIGDFMNIGSRNVAAAKSVLAELGIKILAEDTGGNHGRTIEFDSTTGKVLIKSAMHPIKEI